MQNRDEEKNKQGGLQLDSEDKSEGINQEEVLKYIRDEKIAVTIEDVIRILPKDFEKFRDDYITFALKWKNK